VAEPDLNLEQEAYLSRYARRNYIQYLLVILFSLSASSFGDMSVFVPSLAMRLHAPSWLVAFPMVAGLSIAYAPALLVGWLLGPRTSRAKAYAWSVALMYVPILVLAVFLFRGGSNRLLLPIFTGAIVLYSIAMGVSILPCWDLFSRIFPDSTRPKIIGHAGALGQVATLLSAGVAAWLISSRSPLPHPKNYAAAMVIFATGGLISAGIILRMKEYIPPEPAEHDRSFRAYLRSIARILRTDRPFVSILKVVALAYTVAAVFPVVLSHARLHRGFAGANDLALLVAVRPYFSIPFCLLCGYVAQRIGPARLASILAALIALAIPLALGAWGRWQLIPLFLVLLGETMSTYAMLAVMRRAPAGMMHQYLAIYFTACMIPGLAPIGLGWLLDRWPQAAMLLIFLIAAAAAVAFYLVEPWKPENSPAAHAGAVAAIES
jgi:hypothetical protein